MKPEERATFILGQLNAGLRTEWSQIEGLEASLEKLLHEAKARADSHIAPSHRGTWEEAWNAVHRKLEKIRGCAEAARNSYDAGGDPDVLVPWYEISEHDRELDDLLDT